MLESSPALVLYALPCSVSVCLSALQHVEKAQSFLFWLKLMKPLLPAMLPCFGSSDRLTLVIS